jgi:hypothetical protein
LTKLEKVVQSVVKKLAIFCPKAEYVTKLWKLPLKPMRTAKRKNEEMEGEGGTRLASKDCDKAVQK